ncbi:VOC family protein [Paenibacillus endoradicis]|uniref:VOC family protein n=1 Tax=Paenibacillus endoradicis TaxID=2972487 RepID=UPI002159724A|nr:VOC family protein [Paenibacillus endoradicis]MCR8660017.1 VOC family protein [Paenibacillus endoradicis]
MTFIINENISLGVVKLKVENLARSISFYEKVIGLKSINVSNKSAQLTADGTTILVELEEIENVYTGSHRGHSGLYHFALLLPTRKALGSILRHLIEQRIQLGQADHMVSEALYLSDPDNNGIEIYRDRPRSEWQYDSNNMVKMASDPIDWEGLLRDSEGEVFNGIDVETVMGHIHLHVADLKKADEFYNNILGFSLELDWSANGALFAGAGGYHHHIGLNIWNGRGATPLPDNATGLEYFTIKIPSDGDRELIAERLEKAGYPVLKSEGYMYVVDPFGIGIRLQ